MSTPSPTGCTHHQDAWIRLFSFRDMNIKLRLFLFSSSCSFVHPRQDNPSFFLQSSYPSYSSWRAGQASMSVAMSEPMDAVPIPEPDIPPVSISHGTIQSLHPQAPTTNNLRIPPPEQTSQGATVARTLRSTTIRPTPFKLPPLPTYNCSMGPNPTESVAGGPPFWDVADMPSEWHPPPPRDRRPFPRAPNFLDQEDATGHGIRGQVCGRWLRDWDKLNHNHRSRSDNERHLRQKAMSIGG
ncbi:hypothetical protein B0H65DRAFT_155223 [Neurospora tetraspora]|uniref:Uncharacterized protein n=1 Tax=Neurospora tetraspora TaxID=94610 RepID=A0AAE0JH28_9PEZI|nr:hypothetical protein B0H65DRAFT_155223 [Neurospora tetraspora]